MTIDIDHELTQYIATALWASHDDERASETDSGPMLDANYGPEDIAPEALASMRDDLANFLNGPDYPESDATDLAIDEHERALAFWEAELGAGSIGHDFWLTRNGHGAGFWDRFSAGVGASFGRYLTDCAKPYGDSYLYVGDDGKVYVS